MTILRGALAIPAIAIVLLIGSNTTAQRPKTDMTLPTATGKVIAYEADKSITVEVSKRGGLTEKVEFAIVKDKTKIELTGRIQALAVGVDVRIWADKDNVKNAARIATGTPVANADAPTAAGKATAYEANKSITVEVPKRGKMAEKQEFAIIKDKTKIEFVGETKAIEIGTPVRVWADKDNAKNAERISAGAPMNMRKKNPDPVPQPKVEPKKEPEPAKVDPNSVPRPIKPLGTAQPPQAVAKAIDKEIQRVLDADKILASARADDAEFLRRVYLDIVGKIPAPERVTAFVESKDADKRVHLVNDLLASAEYGKHFADLWCDRINVKDMPIDREPFISWMANNLNQDSGWDKIVQDLMMAQGQFNFITRGRRLGSADPQALFLLLNTEEGQGKGPNPAWLAAESGRLFLGVQLQCAECHNHPFSDSWKQTDFWGMAAFFSGLRAERVAAGGLQWKDVPTTTNVSITIPATSLKNIGKVVPARLLSDAKDYTAADQQVMRHSLARWMTSSDNPYFAKATANRMWAHLFGRGLVDPVDDLRPDNAPSHPAILELVADEFKKSGFDLKYLIRCICLSDAYQRTGVPTSDNEKDTDKYSHMTLKVMGPGVFYDCLKQATGLPELKVGLPERKTKLTVATLFTPREVFVDFFRSAQGEEANPLENNHGIPQALKLMNAAQLNSVLPIAQRLANLDREKAIEQLYLTALARKPTDAELKLIGKYLTKRNDAKPEQGYSAVLWTLINSAEFISNH
jgi:Protein of unknown function (DUF1549)/Protein of unknown function (DUF1553)